MSDENEALVRTAYAALGQGGVSALLELVHPDLEWTYRNEDSFSRSRNTPFDGWDLKGRAVRTIVSGKTAWSV